MTPLQHVMILASAGSGKTYALTNRFVELLARGAEPERIVALTFTRKAAGEFFDEILRKLARAASDRAAAKSLARDIGQPGLGSPDFLRLLRQMVDAMHRLRLGTLDSFFARIARAFPLELGLSGEFEVLQEHAARLARQRVLRRMFARTKGDLDAAHTEFIEAFKRATFGAEEKRLGARLDSFLDRYQENFLSAPDEGCWGEARRIWPAGSPWLETKTDLAEAVRQFRASHIEHTDGQRARWEAFFAGLEEWSPGAPLSPPVEYVVKNVLAAWPDVCRGEAEITIDRRKVRYAGPACEAIRAIITHVVGSEFRRRLQTTRGIYAVLRSYESNYHTAVRRAGQLTFADVQRLLQPSAGAPALSSHALTKQDVEDQSEEETEGQLELSLPDPAGRATDSPEDAEERRLMLDYRLDAEIDHWLLDEFQDTSFGQWSVLQNLIDEVVQDPEQRRSFFCVGDVKQAIYSWREGDPRLFREIYNHYTAAAPGSIVEAHLVASWRSGPALIEMVNTVFGAKAALSELFPGAASTAWNDEWRPHESAVPDRNGQAALLHAEDEEGRWTLTRALLEEVRPIERGLSCAILVQRNDTAAALAEFLRRAGISAIAESDLQIAGDNPLGTALLALVQAAVHPSDTLAREHVQMTPLGTVLVELGLTTPESLSGYVLRQLHTRGFERTMEFWIEKLEPRLDPQDHFTRRRAQEVVAAAGLFDATGSRDGSEFVAFMERHAVRPPESPSVVRVMTIHKSKGLGFDVVILPDLQGNRIDERRDGLAVQKADDRSVQWILDLPPRLFCAQDEVLATHIRSAEADACYESLSLLYVALTRGKRGLYVITEPVGKSTSRNYPKLLAETLGSDSSTVRVGETSFTGAWSAGDPEWHRHLAVQAPKAATTGAGLPLLANVAARPPRRVAVRPSASRSGKVQASSLFSLENGVAAEFGTALHRLLSEVERCEPADVAPLLGAWRERGEFEAVVKLAAFCLESPAFQTVWQVAGTTEVWRERSFEVVLDGLWVTGVFDRVLIDRAPGGRALRATVVDFKTDRISSDDDATVRNRYALQLGTYRKVVAVLTGLDLSNVRGLIALLPTGRLVDARASAGA